jgi:Uma2 family endonuclease
MSLKPKPTLSFEEWLEGERSAREDRSEFVDGEVFAMTGASLDHSAIVSNVNREISIQLKDRPCQVYANDVKVLIRTANAGKYPDLVALCGEPELLDERRDVLLNPSLIVEVLSESTEAYDRGEKFALYRQLPSLQEYLLVAQDRVSVELYTRGTEGRWTLADYRAVSERVSLASIDCTLALSEVYDKVGIARGEELRRPDRGGPEGV